MPIAPSTSSSWLCQEEPRFVILRAPKSAGTLAMSTGHGRPFVQFMHIRHSSAIRNGMSSTTMSAPQMMILAMCSAWAMPPPAISVTRSRRPRSTRCVWIRRNDSLRNSPEPKAPLRPWWFATKVIDSTPAATSRSASAGSPRRSAP